ncbi:hypothetical protein [Brevundimonas naejangsanensis]|uniref:hypothetical protein n=1 Tax=Brevundimonas naejangsanensis TaxID=588932 RepID=UPI0026ECB5FA|nr:hypothetical protein [Brevundimonas naejangsanensis]
MDDAVRSIIIKIIEQESKEKPKWSACKDLAISAIEIINENNIDVPQVVYQFLDDVDVREKDRKYGNWQRQVLCKLLKEGPLF